MMKEFIPVLLGNDINVYSMARAFHEEYRVTSAVFCKIESGPCRDSDIIDLHPIPGIDQTPVFLHHINEFARKNLDKTIILIGCGDSYVEVISRNLEQLENNIIAPYMPFSRIEPLTDKQNFYKLCQEHGIDYPRTFSLSSIEELEQNIPIRAPYVVKAADSPEYWRNPFKGQDKVFILDSEDEMKAAVTKIFQSGYSKSIIIQEYIPGDDSNMRVLTCYSDKNGSVKLMALGHVLLEEHTPKGIGNHAVILNEFNDTLCQQIKVFLERLQYVGFSNFDLKYDARDGKFKAFELNPRQGRSNYYVTHSGYNLAKIVVDEYLNDKSLPQTHIVQTEKLWMVVPKRVAFQYVFAPENKNAMNHLIKSGNSVNPLLYRQDTNIKRRLRILKNILSHYHKFKKYYGESKNV